MKHTEVLEKIYDGLKNKEAREGRKASDDDAGKVLFVPRKPEAHTHPERGQEAGRTQRRTRVEATSPLTLMRNKILSYFHDDEISERVKIVRTQILHKMAEVGGNSLLVTSALPGEGKTFTAVNLAVSLSHELNRTTLLVDADVRKPDVRDRFGIDAPAGLSDYLLGNAEIPDLLVNPGIPNLTILPGGKAVPNSAELLGSPRMAALVEEMKARYEDRILIFDSSSLVTFADPLVFARSVDGVLLVVEAEKTPKKDVTRALKLLAGTPFKGILYNKAPDD